MVKIAFLFVQFTIFSLFYAAMAVVLRVCGVDVCLCLVLGTGNKTISIFSPLPENIQYNTKSTINRLYQQSKVPTCDFLHEPHSNHRPTKKGWQH